jgi:DNA-binding NarL/FixJ family response regulator
MSGNLPQHIIREAISLGAVGFFPKMTPSQNYVTSIHRLASGNPLGGLPEAVDPQVGASCDARGDEPRLTARELRVLQNLAHGKTLDEIGSELGLRDLTLDFVIKTLCRKFAANDAATVLTNAKKAGVV